MSFSQELDLQHQTPIALGRTAEIYALPGNKVLKLFRSGVSTSTVSQEELIAKTVNTLNLPTPGFEGTTEAGGRRGLIYERIEGESLTNHLKKHPWSLFDSIRLAAQLQNNIHQHEVSELPSQKDRLTEEIWRTGLPAEIKDKLGQLLSELHDGNILCHGDYHVDNLYVTSTGLEVIDWATATKGNPLGDLARTLLLLRLGSPPPHTPTLDR